MSRKELEGIIKKLLGIEYELDDRTSLIKYGGDSLFFGRLQIKVDKTNFDKWRKSPFGSAR